MAKSGGPSITTILVLGGIGFAVYELFFATPAPVAATAAPGATTTTPPPASPPPATSSAPAASSTSAGVSVLDQYYQAMLAAASAANFTSGSPDNWGYYFGQANGFAAPAPEDEGFNRQTNWPTNLTAAQYWAAAAPVIQKQKGISGLGAYGTLGMMARRAM